MSNWVTRLVGNGKIATALIFVFIFILCVLFFRCSKADEVDLRGGSSFGPGGAGAVLGLQYVHPLSGLQGVDVYAGTLLWGATPRTANNWSWEAGLHTCRWKICAAIGASYLQRIDEVNGAHTNYNLELSYLIGWHRLNSLDLAHLSDAGTTAVNLGRNAGLVSFKLQ